MDAYVHELDRRNSYWQPIGKINKGVPEHTVPHPEQTTTSHMALKHSKAHVSDDDENVPVCHRDVNVLEIVEPETGMQ